MSITALSTSEGQELTTAQLDLQQRAREFVENVLMPLELEAEERGGRLLALHVARMIDAGADPKLIHAKASMAKLFVSEAAGRCADRAVQAFGGRGYLRSNVAERFLRELRVDRIWEGTSEVQRLIISRALERRGVQATIHCHPCVPTIAELPTAVDAVVVAIPAAGVPAVVEDAGARGCGGAVVISAGFAEVTSGVELQRELVQAAALHGLPVCGPNCNGIVSMHAKSALWGDALSPREPGAVALISQSGNVAVNALAAQRGLRLHTVIGSGNQAVLSAADYLGVLAREPGVGAIALYLEDDGAPGLCDGFAACAEAGVGVAVLKVGSSPSGARAAAAHSGALAGDQRVFKSLVEEAGAVWAADVHELLELAKTLAVPRRGADPRGGGLAIMTCSGGDSAQGADEAKRRALALPALAPATCDRLRELLPAAATIANPLDYTAMIWGQRDALSELVRTVGEDPGIDQVLVFYDQPPGWTARSRSLGEPSRRASARARLSVQRRRWSAPRCPSC